ncbi:hypothetical protein Zm00014a_007774 [Zea mays]|uniref:SNRNP25 ubiquitin-like domain-containing protein n=1 Tax=Zea mays TaxID=4577 RepID=A0A3L6EDZ5_MAIZE|nr:hypothetical protein Zm00014a_007774 [Zea mays]
MKINSDQTDSKALPRVTWRFPLDDTSRFWSTTAASARDGANDNKICPEHTSPQAVAHTALAHSPAADGAGMSHFCLCFKDVRLTDDKATLRGFGIRDGDVIHALP